MKFLFKSLFVFSLVFLILNFGLYLLDSGHIVSYSIGNYTVKENFSSDGNEYFFVINGEDSHLSFKINYDFKKSEKVLSKLYFKEIDGYMCYLPLFGGEVLTDVMCNLDDTIYYGHDLDISETYEYFKKYGYDSKKYVDDSDYIVVSSTINLYKGNLPSNNYLALESYNGLTLFNGKEASLKLFDRDVYKKPLSIFTGKYYLVADYNSDYTFKNFYLVNIVNGDKKNIRSYDDIFFDSYIMGECEGKVYLFDKENKIQYEIDLENEEVNQVGDRDNIKFYNGEWTSISLNEALNDKKFKVKSSIKGYDRVDSFGNDYYLYNKKDDKYEVYLMDKRDDSIKTYIFTTSSLNDIVYLEDRVYFKDGNSLNYFGKNGIRKVLTNTEFEFNDDISIGVYSK